MNLYDARLGEALKLAADAFMQIERKGRGIPYLTHLLHVTTLVLEHGGDADQAVAAVLHDYLEDIPGASADDLEQRFGRRVRQLVQELSDSTTPGAKAPWKERKLRYLAHLTVASPDVKLIAAADKVHNAESLVEDRERSGDAVFLRFTAPKRETQWYYVAVLEALREGFAHPLLDRLEHAVRAIARD